MQILKKLLNLFRRRKLEAEMTEEMRTHLALQADRHRQAGLNERDARYAAQREFGNVASLQEQVREGRSIVFLETLAQDMRYAFRALGRNPGFTATVVLTLALGLGATTTILTVADSVLWRSLPYVEAERLVTVSRLTGEMLRDWRQEQQAVEGIETYATQSRVLSSASEPLQVAAGALSPGLLGLLGRPPVLGRGFSPGEGERGNHRVALLSHGTWEQHFGGDPGVIGRTVTIDEETHVVIGVMPRDFSFPRPGIQFWTPLVQPVTEGELRRRVEAVARLRPGVALAAARESVKALNVRLGQEKPLARGWDVALEPLDKYRVNRGPRRMLLLVLGAAGFVLLIACANVTNLLLVRTAARQRELAVRVALGAGRGRMMRQILTESLLLATLGAAGGLLFAQWAARSLWLLAPTDLTFLVLNEVGLDWRIFGCTAVLTGLVTVLCGVGPALRASSSDTRPALASAGRTATAGRSQQRWQQALVVVQCALAFVLLVGAGLLMRGFHRLGAVEPGFAIRNIASLALQLPATRYPTAENRQDFLEQLRSSIAALPGVVAASVATDIPPRGGGFYFTPTVEIEGRAPESLGSNELLPFNHVDGNFFRTMSIPLLGGREFGEQDSRGAPPAVIINDRMARRFWPNATAIGQRIRFDAQQPWLTVVGVVGDVKAMSLDDEHGGLEFYRPRTQESSGGYAAVVIRTQGDPRLAIPAIRSRLRAQDAKLPVISLAPAEVLMARTLALPRFNLVLMAAFAGAALLLAAIGLYGVLSYATAQRTTEIGIRVALGGTPDGMVWLIVRRGLAMAGLGLAAGIAAAAGLTRLLGSMLFEVSALDPLTFGSVAALLGGIALLACWLPARRAAKVDPIVALRAD